MGVNSARRPVSDVLGTEGVAVVHYELDPGESFSGGLHTHHDQEEIFVILEGEATFTVGLDRDELTVEAGEAVRFAPGEFQFGRNQSDDRVVGIIIAAPGDRHNWEDIEAIAPCPTCGEETSHGVDLVDSRELVSFCMECGHEYRSD